MPATMALSEKFARFAIGAREIFGSKPDPSIIDKLPTELLDNIAGHLSTKDLSALSMTSKRLNEIATPYLYRSFTPRPPYAKQIALLIRTLNSRKELAGYVRLVELHQGHCSMSTKDVEKVQEIMCRRKCVLERLSDGIRYLVTDEEILPEDDVLAIEDGLLLRLLVLTTSLKLASISGRYLRSGTLLSGLRPGLPGLPGTRYGERTIYSLLTLPDPSNLPSFHRLSELTLSWAANTSTLEADWQQRFDQTSRFLTRFIMIPSLRTLRLQHLQGPGIRISDRDIPPARCSNIENLTLDCTNCTDYTVDHPAGGMLSGLPKLLRAFRNLSRFRWICHTQQWVWWGVVTVPPDGTFLPGAEFEDFPRLLAPVRRTLEHLSIHIIPRLSAAYQRDSYSDLHRVRPIGSLRRFTKLKSLDLPYSAITPTPFAPNPDNPDQLQQHFRHLERLPKSLEQLTIQPLARYPLEPALFLAVFAVVFFHARRNISLDNAAALVNVDTTRWRIDENTRSYIIPFEDEEALEGRSGLDIDAYEELDETERRASMTSALLVYLAYVWAEWRSVEEVFGRLGVDRPKQPVELAAEHHNAT